MGNTIFKAGTRAPRAFTAGTYVGEIHEIDTRYNTQGDCFHIFQGTVEFDGTTHRVSTIASDDTKITRKLVRYMLALDGKTPEDVPVDADGVPVLDLATLPESGRALFVIKYERSRRTTDPATGKVVYETEHTEFPQLADILPMPRGVTFATGNEPRNADEVPF